jgi:hypothetical protein
MARRKGLVLVKSRSPATVQQRGGFMIMDAAGQIVAGGVPAYSLSAGDVEQFLLKGMTNG